MLNCYDSLPEGIFEIRAPDVKFEVGKEIEFSGEKSQKLIEQILECSKEQGININSVDITDELAITVKAENRFNVNFGSANFLENKFAHLAGMIKNIETDKTGKINLSMWTSSQTQGTFVEGGLE